MRTKTPLCGYYGQNAKPPTRANRTLLILRRAGSATTTKYTIGGREKTGGFRPRSPSMPTIIFRET